MSAISPAQSSPISPATFHRIIELYESIKSIEVTSRSKHKTVSLNLPPVKLDDVSYQSIQCYMKGSPEDRHKAAPILYKATTLSNFIDFIYALYTMKEDEVSHVIALDLNLFTYATPPEGFEKFYSLLQQKCPHLRELIWGNNLPIDDYFFEFLKGFPNLTRLNLTSCSDKIKDEHLKRLASSHPNMVELNLSGCDQVTDKGIQCLPLLNRLEKLNLSYLDKVTDKSLIPIILLKRLRYIDLFNTSVTNDCVRELKIDGKRKNLNVQFEDEIILTDYSADVFGI